MEGLTQTTGTQIAAKRLPLLAARWHTIALVALLFVVSYFSAQAIQVVSRQSDRRVLHYAFTIAYECLLLGFVWFGVRTSHVKIRELIGGRWMRLEDFFLDVAIAAGFWIVAFAVLAGLGYLLGLAKGPAQIDEAKKIIRMLAPRNALELSAFAVMSCVAGFCEEIIFRGYLQRQFAAIARSIWLGMLLSALVFGLSHAYEGQQRMILITVYGAMFGTLAILRKSLRPGMIAHAWHDTFQGALLMLAAQLMKNGMLK